MKLDKASWVLLTVTGLAIGSFGGAGVYLITEQDERAAYTTTCVAGQLRVVESDKTREFHVMWDESCPK